MIHTGLDRLLDDTSALAGRRYGLLTHLAAVSGDLLPAHLALERAGLPPQRLFGPEHGLYGQAQDMEATEDALDPWTGARVVSLYGDAAESLVPDPACFEGLDLLVIDLQDIGARYYTYAATAVWSARVALEAGCDVWVLDRPNPLGGAEVEGNRRQSDLESFVGAFEQPARHGLTIAEIVRLELARVGLEEAIETYALSGWRRWMIWRHLGRPWIAPSPNMPTPTTATLYPGLCLVEATNISEGRGTTRPFQLVGAPEIDPLALADALSRRGLEGVRFMPTRFRPRFQKHAGNDCGGVEVVVSDEERVQPFRLGVELILELASQPGFAWRTEPYEFVGDRPAIDLLSGDTALRAAVDEGRTPTTWIDGWSADEAEFRRLREPYLLYA